MSDIWDKIWERCNGMRAHDILRAKYDAVTNYTRFQEIEMLSYVLGNENVSLACDAGCGIGIADTFLTKKGIDVVGIDFSEIGLRRAMEFHNSFESPGNFLVVRADIRGIPFSDETFDLVWNSGTVEHFDDNVQVNVLKEMVRVTKRDGIVVMFVPNFFNLITLHLLASNFLKKVGLGDGWIYGYEKPMHFKSLLSLVEKDFRVSTEYCGGIAPFLSTFPPLASSIARLATTISEKFEKSVIAKLFGREVVVKLRRVK